MNSILRKLFICNLFLIIGGCTTKPKNLRYYETYLVKFAKTKVEVEQGGFELYLPQHFVWTVEEVDLGVDTVIALHAGTNQQGTPVDILTVEKGKPPYTTTPEAEIALIRERHQEHLQLIGTGPLDWFPAAFYVHFCMPSPKNNHKQLLAVVFKDDLGHIYYAMASLAAGVNTHQRMAVMVQSLKTLRVR